MDGESGDVDDDFDTAGRVAGDDDKDLDTAELADGEGAEDDSPQAGPSRGSVRTATWRRGKVPYLLTDVIAARTAAELAERQLAKRVKSARAHGATWEDLGLALGLSRQGAAKRYG